jgi:hypothetical protein
MSTPTASPRRRARRSLVAVVLTMATLATVGVTAAAAAPTRGGCPPGGGSPWALADIGAWEARSKEGLIGEFDTLDAAATELLGPGKTWNDDLRKLVLDNFALIDADGDDKICMSSTNPVGLPDYFISVRDNRVPLRR